MRRSPARTVPTVLLLLAAGLGLRAATGVTVPEAAHAQEAAGHLHCAVIGRETPIVGAYTHLDCQYDRLGQRPELYGGYTGFIATGLAGAGARSLDFDVISKRPRSFADLEGRYRLTIRAQENGVARPVLDGTLYGGRDDDVLLRPLDAVSIPLDLSNALLGLAQIELTYRGEIGRAQRSQADD